MVLIFWSDGAEGAAIGHERRRRKPVCGGGAFWGSGTAPRRRVRACVHVGQVGDVAARRKRFWFGSFGRMGRRGRHVRNATPHTATQRTTPHRPVSRKWPMNDFLRFEYTFSFVYLLFGLFLGSVGYIVRTPVACAAILEALRSACVLPKFRPKNWVLGAGGPKRGCLETTSQLSPNAL